MNSNQLQNDLIFDNNLASSIGVEIVDILYKNTNLNYDVCAYNLVEIFEHLSSKLPQLNDLSSKLIDSIKTSIGDKNSNPDLTSLENNFTYLFNLNAELQTGEKNFYEVNESLLAYLKHSIKLISEQSNPKVFKDVLIQNRQSLLSLFEIWQLCTDKQIKNNIIKLFNISFYSDKTLVRLLYENTNLACELCFMIKQEVLSNDPNYLVDSLKCLILIFSNTNTIPLTFHDFLKSSDFIQTILMAIESDKSYLYQKQANIISSTNQDEVNNNKSNQTQEICILDLFVHLLLCMNKKFIQPEDNLISSLIISNMDDGIHNYKTLSETLINLFNFENDPLIDYHINKTEPDGVNEIGNDLNDFSLQYFCSNSVLKLISDLFSSNKTKNSTSIFYSNDFYVLLDVIIRKLSNLSADDQIRVDYLSLVQLIIQNSNYMQITYRKDDLLEVFNSILNEKDQDTIDQDIIRVILSENPNLIFD